MTCPKCSGLLVPETVHDVALSEDLLRCVNCGNVVTRMPRTDETTAQSAGPRNCTRCKQRPANPGRAHCEPCRKITRAYMTNRTLRLDVKARGFKVVLAEVTEKLLQIEAKRNLLMKHRKAWGG